MPKNSGYCNLKHILIAATGGFRFSFYVSKLWIFIKYWLPSLMWMVVIFSASADRHSAERSFSLVGPLLRWLFPQMPQPEVDDIHHVLRKCAHLTEYAILALLLRRTLASTVAAGNSAWSGKLIATVIAMVFLYAASDEFHQSFVPGRTSLFSDVLVDTAGGTVGLLAGWGWHRFRKPR